MICGPQYVAFHVKRFQFHVEQPGGHTAAHVSVVDKCLVGRGHVNSFGRTDFAGMDFCRCLRETPTGLGLPQIQLVNLVPVPWCPGVRVNMLRIADE